MAGSVDGYDYQVAVKHRRSSSEDIDCSQLLDAVTRLDEIPLASIGLHKLSREREGQWAMTINGPWRVVFTFRDGDAYDVEIVDYH